MTDFLTEITYIELPHKLCLFIIIISAVGKGISLLQVAVVADRALLAVFVIITAISTAAILLPQLNNLHVGNTPLKPPI